MLIVVDAIAVLFLVALVIMALTQVVEYYSRRSKGTPTIDQLQAKVDDLEAEAVALIKTEKLPERSKMLEQDIKQRKEKLGVQEKANPK